MADLPETASFREFADIVPCRPSWVTQLRTAGRLVLTEDGKRVRVRESLQRIEDTRDESKAGVSERHAAARVAAAAPSAGQPGAAPAPAQSAVPPPEAPPAPERSGYQQARAVKERYLAMAAKRDYERSIGKLVDADEVAHVTAAAAASLRVGFEGLADFLAPQLVGIRDITTARNLIADAVEQRLAELSRQFANIARAPTT